MLHGKINSNASAAANYSHRLSSYYEQKNFLWRELRRGTGSRVLTNVLAVLFQQFKRWRRDCCLDSNGKRTATRQNMTMLGPDSSPTQCPHCHQQIEYLATVLRKSSWDYLFTCSCLLINSGPKSKQSPASFQSCPEWFYASLGIVRIKNRIYTFLWMY